MIKSGAREAVDRSNVVVARCTFFELCVGLEDVIDIPHPSIVEKYEVICSHKYSCLKYIVYKTEQLNKKKG